VPEVLSLLAHGGAEVPVVVGGIIPPTDERKLLAAGVARVYTPKDFEVNRIMGEIVELVAERSHAAATA
jgi:(2R)-ethylmalonyl-CoA mutase